MSNGMWVGTPVFRTLKEAIRYYRDYGFTGCEVRAKLARSEILIGKLKRVPGIILLCDRGRWFYRRM
jgi:hypothetical protein